MFVYIGVLFLNTFTVLKMKTLEDKLLEFVESRGGANLSEIARKLDIHNNTAKDLAVELRRQKKVRFLRERKPGTKFVVPIAR
jgi:predicted ArsR family transcriptional regulator